MYLLIPIHQQAQTIPTIRLPTNHIRHHLPHVPHHHSPQPRKLQPAHLQNTNLHHNNSQHQRHRTPHLTTRPPTQPNPNLQAQSQLPSKNLPTNQNNTPHIRQLQQVHKGQLNLPQTISTNISTNLIHTLHTQHNLLQLPSRNLASPNQPFKPHPLPDPNSAHSTLTSAPRHGVQHPPYTTPSQYRPGIPVPSSDAPTNHPATNEPNTQHDGQSAPAPTH